MVDNVATLQIVSCVDVETYIQSCFFQKISFTTLISTIYSVKVIRNISLNLLALASNRKLFSFCMSFNYHPQMLEVNSVHMIGLISDAAAKMFTFKLLKYSNLILRCTEFNT